MLTDFYVFFIFKKKPNISPTTPIIISRYLKPFFQLYILTHSAINLNSDLSAHKRERKKKKGKTYTNKSGKSKVDQKRNKENADN